MDKRSWLIDQNKQIRQKDRQKDEKKDRKMLSTTEKSKKKLMIERNFLA